MRVILTEDVLKLGDKGKIVEVKDGYARNYLLPYNKCKIASSQNLKIYEHEKKLAEGRLKKENLVLIKLKEKIETLSITIPQKIGEQEKLFGSVTQIDIEKALKENGVDIDRKKIELEEPIKNLGIYSIPIKIDVDLKAILKLSVVKSE